MKILITAFDPFGGDVVNPALEAVKLIRPELFDAQIINWRSPLFSARPLKLPPPRC